MKILISEDNLNSRKMIQQMLRMDGHDTFLDDGAEAGAVLAGEKRADIVMMNLFSHNLDVSLEENDEELSAREIMDPVILLTSQATARLFANFLRKSAKFLPQDSYFEHLSPQGKVAAMDRILQLCNNLDRCKSLHRQGGRA